MKKQLLVALLCLILLSCGDGGIDPKDVIKTSSFLLGGVVSRVLDSGSEYLANAMVVVQNIDLGRVYQAVIDVTGSFEIAVEGFMDTSSSIKDGGTSYMVAIVSSDGTPLGSISFDDGSGESAQALEMTDGAYLVVSVPEDPLAEPITAGGSFNVNPDVTIKTDANGVAVGLASFGKGVEAQGTGDPDNRADPDGDGLINILDADDDGDGIADEFDDDTDAAATGNDKFKISFGYLLDLENTDVLDYLPREDIPLEASTGAPSYFGPASDDERAIVGLTRDMRLDIWIEPQNSTDLAEAWALETPGPAYMADLVTGPAQTPAAWATMMTENSCSYAVQVQPGAEPDRKAGVYFNFDTLDYINLAGQPQFEVGDTLTFALREEGAQEPVYLSKMINFVFKKPFMFREYSDPVSPDNFIAYFPGYQTENDIPLNPANGLTLVITPPQDETGEPLLAGAEFGVSINFIDDSAAQINDLDTAETNAVNWPTVPETDGVAWEGRRWHEPVESMNYLSMDEDGAFTLVIPSEMFKTTIKDSSGTTHNVGSYIIGCTFTVGEYSTWNASIIQNRITCIPQ
ncbi:MAG: hypothetical protein ABIJ86_08645 [Spirochaetota bacterium]